MVVLRLLCRTSAVAVLAAIVGIASPLAVGCSRGKDARSAESEAQAQAQAEADVNARLRGAWILQSFVPETPLDPMLAALLESQYGRLLIRLDGKRLVAESVGIHVDRAYRVSEIWVDRFKLSVFDDQGVPYESICTFLPNGTVDVRSRTSPWRGVALVSRAGP
jgi:hypothetical protein